MPGGTDPVNSMKKTGATIFYEKTDENGNAGAGDVSDSRWYWYSGVPEHFKPPVKHSQDLELRTINDRTEDNNKKEEAEESVHLKTLLAGLADFTTLHGITHIYFSRGIIQRAAWSLIFLASLIFVTVHLWIMVEGYISFDVNTHVQLIEERPLEFPAITICNINAIRKSSIPAALLQLVDDDKAGVLNGSDHANTRLLRVIAEKLAMLSSTNRNNLGYAMNELIIYCSFNGERCDRTDFWCFHDSMYGNCYTFNSGKEDGANGTKNSTLPGPSYGLTMVLNAALYEYVPFLTEEAGVKVVIHDKEAMPFPEHSGLLVAPGMTTNIAIAKSHMSQLGGKYGNCTNPSPATDVYNMYTEQYKVNYTQQACLRTCYQKALVKTCHCHDPFLPYDKSSGAFSGVKVVSSPCVLQNKENWLCTRATLEKYASNSLKCDHCPQLCRDFRSRHKSNLI